MMSADGHFYTKWTSEPNDAVQHVCKISADGRHTVHRYGAHPGCLAAKCRGLTVLVSHTCPCCLTSRALSHIDVVPFCHRFAAVRYRLYNIIFSYNIACSKCRYTTMDFCFMTYDEERLLQFLEQHNVVSGLWWCERCYALFCSDVARREFRRDRRHMSVDGRHCQKTRHCSYSKSILADKKIWVSDFFSIFTTHEAVWNRFRSRLRSLLYVIGIG